MFIARTLFVRFGDGLAALTVFLGIQFLQLPLRAFIIFNIFLVICWLITAGVLVYDNRRLNMDSAKDRKYPA